MTGDKDEESDHRCLFKIVAARSLFRVLGKELKSSIHSLLSQ